MFYYLYWKDLGYVKNLARAFKRLINGNKFIFNTSYAFDAFLDYAKEARLSDSIYHPLGIHFATHTAPMWDDITDLDGKVLLKAVFRLENLTEGINTTFEKCGIDKRLSVSKKELNKNRWRGQYVPTRMQIKKIEDIYFNDFEIYEKFAH